METHKINLWLPFQFLLFFLLGLGIAFYISNEKIQATKIEAIKYIGEAVQCERELKNLYPGK